MPRLPRRAIVRLLALAVATAMPSAASACGTADAPCDAAPGMFRLSMPPAPAGPTHAGPVPAVLFLHGWNSASGAVMADADLAATLAARGYALIAPEGIPREGRDARDWAVRDGGSHPRDDLAFLRRVIADAGRRGVDTSRILLAGFSRGGSMVWDAACREPGLARAYAPVAGAFWEPLPEACAGPVDLFHTHGWADRVVPLEGRVLGGGRVVQGDVFAALALMRAATGCAARMPETAPAEGGLWFRHWESCTGGRLDLMLHPGGHRVPEGWADRALDWFEARLAEGREAAR